MITTTMRRLVPEELITPLKLLGKYDWLRWTPINTTPAGDGPIGGVGTSGISPVATPGRPES